jgi:hypothetical protein
VTWPVTPSSPVYVRVAMLAVRLVVGPECISVGPSA